MSGSNYTTTPNLGLFKPNFAADYRDATNTIRLYSDGGVPASVAGAFTFFPSTSDCIIGNDPESGYVANFIGYIDEVRVTKGVARYAGAFTKPTAPFWDPSQSAAAAQARVMVMA